MRKHSKKTKDKMSKSHIGLKHSKETIKKMSEAQKGRKITEEHRKNISISKLGKKLPPFSREHCKKIGEAHKGKIVSPETRKKLSENHADVRGKKNPAYIDGASFLPYCEKFNEKKKEKIRNRANRTCRLCGKSEILNGKRLDVHHIDRDKMQGCNSKRWYLIALCGECHLSIRKNPIINEFLIVTNNWRSL